MKSTTSCFVRVKDAKERKELIEWLCDIGRPHRKVVPLNVFPFIVAYDGWHDNVSIESIKIYREEILGLIDCGENIELFKALAAMNDENDMQQLFICDTYADMGCVMWHLCEETKFKHYYVEWEDGETDIRSYFRKATTDEIIEYFKRGGNERDLIQRQAPRK